MTDTEQTKKILDRVEETVDTSVDTAIQKYVDGKITSLHSQFNDRMDSQDIKLDNLVINTAGIIELAQGGTRVFRVSSKTIFFLGKVAAAITAVLYLAKIVVGIAITSK